MSKEIAREQFPSRIKATFNVAGSAEGGLTKVSKEIAREQFPSKEDRYELVLVGNKVK